MLLKLEASADEYLSGRTVGWSTSRAKTSPTVQLIGRSRGGDRREGHAPYFPPKRFPLLCPAPLGRKH